MTPLPSSIRIGVHESATPGPWVDWNGGECPVPLSTRVDVMYRDGIVAIDVIARHLCGSDSDLHSPESSCWQHNTASPCNDITAYRVVSA
jgi:hypothetical protein